MAGFLGSVSLGSGGGGYLGEVSIVGGVVPTTLPIGIPVTGGSAGAILYEDAAQNLAALADVALGQVLVSGGVGAIPAYSGSPSLSGNLSFTKEVAHTITVSQSTTAATAGAALTMTAGAATAAAASNGGNINITAGASTGAAGGNGGSARQTGGAAIGGTGGSSRVIGGASTNAVGGLVQIIGGVGGTTGGDAFLTGGVGTVTGGAVDIDGGAGGAGGAVTIGTANAASITIGRTGIVTRHLGNASLGLTALGTNANLCLGFSNGAVAPTTSVDMAQIYGADVNGAGTAGFGWFTEVAPAVGAAVASTHTYQILINNVLYKILLSNV